jgi:hypothetical protein
MWSEVVEFFRKSKICSFFEFRISNELELVGMEVRQRVYRRISA